MKISDFNVFKNTLDFSPALCVFAVHNDMFTNESKNVFDTVRDKYKTSMFFNFCEITQPLSENTDFLKSISQASCFIVNQTSNMALTSTLCNDFGSVPITVCSPSDFVHPQSVSIHWSH